MPVLLPDKILVEESGGILRWVLKYRISRTERVLRGETVELRWSGSLASDGSGSLNAVASSGVMGATNGSVAGVDGWGSYPGPYDGVRYVSESGNDLSGDGLSVGTAYRTISRACQDVVGGETWNIRVVRKTPAPVFTEIGLSLSGGTKNGRSRSRPHVVEGWGPGSDPIINVSGDGFVRFEGSAAVGGMVFRGFDVRCTGGALGLTVTCPVNGSGLVFEGIRWSGDFLNVVKLEVVNQSPPYSGMVGADGVVFYRCVHGRPRYATHAQGTYCYLARRCRWVECFYEYCGWQAPGQPNTFGHGQYFFGGTEGAEFEDSVVMYAGMNGVSHNAPSDISGSYFFACPTGVHQRAGGMTGMSRSVIEEGAAHYDGSIYVDISVGMQVNVKNPDPNPNPNTESGPAVYRKVAIVKKGGTPWGAAITLVGQRTSRRDILFEKCVIYRWREKGVVWSGESLVPGDLPSMDRLFVRGCVVDMSDADGERTCLEFQQSFSPWSNYFGSGNWWFGTGGALFRQNGTPISASTFSTHETGSRYGERPEYPAEGRGLRDYAATLGLSLEGYRAACAASTMTTWNERLISSDPASYVLAGYISDADDVVPATNAPAYSVTQVGGTGSSMQSGLTYDLGSVQAGGSQTLKFQVMNTGTAPLVWTAVNVVNQVKQAFSLAATPTPTTLAVGFSGTFEVAFAPDEVTSYQASVLLANSSGIDPFMFVVRGEGTTPPLGAFLVTLGLDVIQASSTRDIGPTVVGQPRVVSMLVKNQGTGTLTITGTSLTNVSGSAFSVLQAVSGALAPGDSSVLRIEANPAAPGSCEALVTLGVSGAPGPFEFSLASQASSAPTPPSWYLFVEDGPTLAPNETNDLGLVTEHVDSPFTLRIANSGELPMVMSSISLTNSGTSAYSISSNPTASGAVMLGSGQSVALGVMVKAQTTGTHEADLWITTTTAGVENYKCSLLVTAIPAPVGALTLRYNGADIVPEFGVHFGQVPRESSATFTLLAINTGTAPFGMTASLTNIQGSSMSLASPVSGTIAPGASMPIRVVVSGTSGSGEVRASLLVDSPEIGGTDVTLGAMLTDPTTSPPSWWIYVQDGPVLLDDPGPVVVAETPAGSPVSMTVQVMNAGGMPLPLRRVTLANIAGQAFSITQSPVDGITPLVLHPQESVPVSISYAPTVSGTHQARIQFQSDAIAPLTCVVAGVATASTLPGISVTVEGVPLSNGGRIDFGVGTYGVERSKNIVVTNSGASPLVVSSVSITHNDTNAFELGNTIDGQTIAPGDSRTVVLIMHSTTPGNASGILTIQGDGIAPFSCALLGNVPRQRPERSRHMLCWAWYGDHQHAQSLGSRIEAITVAELAIGDPDARAVMVAAFSELARRPRGRRCLILRHIGEQRSGRPAFADNVDPLSLVIAKHYNDAAWIDVMVDAFSYAIGKVPELAHLDAIVVDYEDEEAHPPGKSWDQLGATHAERVAALTPVVQLGSRLKANLNSSLRSLTVGQMVAYPLDQRVAYKFEWNNYSKACIGQSLRRVVVDGWKRATGRRVPTIIAYDLYDSTRPLPNHHGIVCAKESSAPGLCSSPECYINNGVAGNQAYQASSKSIAWQTFVRAVNRIGAMDPWKSVVPWFAMPKFRIDAQSPRWQKYTMSDALVEVAAEAGISHIMGWFYGYNPGVSYQDELDHLNDKLENTPMSSSPTRRFGPFSYDADTIRVGKRVFTYDPSEWM